MKISKLARNQKPLSETNRNHSNAKHDILSAFLCTDHSRLNLKNNRFVAFSAVITII